jgi:hypothetical protein
MTSLRDLLKKTKESNKILKESTNKILKESTDKILDADIEKNLEKTAKASWRGIKSFFLLVLFCIPIAIFSLIIYWQVYQPYWCKKTFEDTVQYEEKIKKMYSLQFVELREEWFNNSCHREFDIPAPDHNAFVYWQIYFENAYNGNK